MLAPLGVELALLPETTRLIPSTGLLGLFGCGRSEAAGGGPEGAAKGAMSSRVPVLPRRLWKGDVGEATDTGGARFSAGLVGETGDDDPGPQVPAVLANEGDVG